MYYQELTKAGLRTQDSHPYWGHDVMKYNPIGFYRVFYRPDPIEFKKVGFSHPWTTLILAQWWENLLHSSGGKLELSKCFYYMFHWMFDLQGAATFSPISTFPDPIILTNSVTKEATIIEHKPCSESHKTLGKMENPTGKRRRWIKTNHW